MLDEVGAKIVQIRIGSVWRACVLGDGFCLISSLVLDLSDLFYHMVCKSLQ